MSTPADSHAMKSRSFLGEVEDFGQSALHAAIENPINGCIQIVDHASNSHLPELNIIGAPTHNSFGSKAGAIVGTAADIIGISILTGGAADIIGGAGLAGGVATAAATGAIYGSVFTPTDNDSKHFVRDRLANGAIGAATFATMNGAAQALSASGMFAVPGARSLTGSLTFGGLSGASGGLASAEATAIFKQARLLPSLGDLAKSVASSAFFGATYGGLGYAYNRAAGSTTEIVTDKGKIRTINDASGQPVVAKAVFPDDSPPQDSNLALNATKMADGSWKTSGYYIEKANGEIWKDPIYEKVTGVSNNGNGTVSMLTDNGQVRTFAPEHYSQSNPHFEDMMANYKYGLTNYDRTASNGSRDTASDEQGLRNFDASGRTSYFSDQAISRNGAHLSYNSEGELDRVNFSHFIGLPGHSVQKVGDNLWQYNVGDDVYRWNGSIETVKDPTTGTVNGLTIKPEGGQPINYDSHSAPETALTPIRATGTYEGLRPGTAYARTTEDGSVVLKAEPNQHLTINGHEAQGEVAVKPGDDVTVKVNMGDRAPHWENHQVNIGTSGNGHTTVAGEEVGGRPVNLSKLVANRVLAMEKQ